MGWGAVAPAMSPTATGSWAQIGAELRMALPPDELAAAESATPTSYFTDPRLSRAVWQIATGVRFTGGRVLETGCGSGAFMAAAPADLRLRWTGVERDPTSARVAQARFPGAQIIASPLELVPLPAGVFDLAIGNVPFADVQIYDKDAPKLTLHNYCLWRSLNAVHAGGYVIAVTSRYTMDATSPGQRAELAALGNLVGAIRLPSGALGEAGTTGTQHVGLGNVVAAKDTQKGQRRERTMPEELLSAIADSPLDLPRVVIPPSVAALLGERAEGPPAIPGRVPGSRDAPTTARRPRSPWGHHPRSRRGVAAGNRTNSAWISLLSCNPASKRASGLRSQRRGRRSLRYPHTRRTHWTSASLPAECPGGCAGRDCPRTAGRSRTKRAV